MFSYVFCSSIVTSLSLQLLSAAVQESDCICSYDDTYDSSLLIAPNSCASSLGSQRLRARRHPAGGARTDGAEGSSLDAQLKGGTVHADGTLLAAMSPGAGEGTRGPPDSVACQHKPLPPALVPVRAQSPLDSEACQDTPLPPAVASTRPLSSASVSSKSAHLTDLGASSRVPQSK